MVFLTPLIHPALAAANQPWLHVEVLALGLSKHKLLFLSLFPKESNDFLLLVISEQPHFPLFASLTLLSPRDSIPYIKCSLLAGPFMMSTFSPDPHRYNMVTPVLNTLSCMCRGFNAYLLNEYTLRRRMLT